MSTFAKHSAVVTAIVVLSAFTMSANLVAQSVEIDPYFSNYRFKESQPFSGSMRFASGPTYGEDATIIFELTAHAGLDTVQVFECVSLGVHPLEFDPPRLIWEAPIDSGMSRKFEVVAPLDVVGGCEILLSRQIPYGWQNLGHLIMVLDEDGKPLCTGSFGDCGSPPVPLHPHRNASNLRIGFPQLAERKNQPQNRDFAASFDFITPPLKGDTTVIEVKLECFRNLYREIQFVVEHSTNLKVVELPESWGNAVGVHPDHRHFVDTLSIVILRDGLGYLEFEVVGRHPHARRGNHLTTSFPIYFLTSDADGLLFIGDFDPIKRFSSLKPEFLGSVQNLIAAGNSDFRTKYVTSKPDFRADADSIAADSTADSSE